MGFRVARPGRRSGRQLLGSHLRQRLRRRVAAPPLRLQASKGARSCPHGMHRCPQARTLATCMLTGAPHTTGSKRHAACYNHSSGGGADEGHAPFHSSKAGTRTRSATPSRVSKLLTYAPSSACGCALLPPANPRLRFNTWRIQAISCASKPHMYRLGCTYARFLLPAGREPVYTSSQTVACM